MMSLTDCCKAMSLPLISFRVWQSGELPPHSRCPWRATCFHVYGLRRVYGQVDDLPVDTQAVKFRIERTHALETEVAVFVQADRVKCFYAVQGDSLEVECLAVGFGNPSVDFKLFFLVFTSRSQLS